MLPIVKPSFVEACSAGDRHKVFIDRGIQLIGGNITVVGKHPKLLRGDRENPFGIRPGHQVDFAVGDNTGIVFQVEVDEAKRCFANVFPIGVPANADHRCDHVTSPVQAVDTFQSTDHPFVGIHGKDPVLVTVDKQQRPRGDERCDACPRPLVGVVQKHAITMALDHATADI